MHYSLPSGHSAAVAAATAAASLPPGYLTLPYSSLHDLQMGMHQNPSMVPIAAHIQLNNGGIPLVKPIMTLSESMIGLNHPGIQVVGGVPLQQAQLAQLSMGHGNPSAMATAMMQAPSAVGSWVTPIPVMNSCVIDNPFQPGTMAAPWVK